MKDKNEARREFVGKKSVKEQREYLPIFAIRKECMHENEYTNGLD
ncbi:unnamed protein product [Pocillopora meandrina]|uniref:Uncharacterized protein n=1 Tax=Pocillopora meandrina TaxID=46732 RepID=A0AAU9X149_9CNID|nr:unnamed protein product [Pocillopora meandrina]